MGAHALASKWRRALRRGTGANFTSEQLQELANYGFLRTLAEIEADELCPAKTAPTDETPTGSTSAGTGNRPIGKSPRPSGGQSYIEALAN